jgi:hypothetical protein
MKITEEIIKELDELAIWDGCETGGYCHALLELRESYLPTYSSIEFSEALDSELIVLYNDLKSFKADEDELAVELSYADKRKNALDKLTIEEKKILGLI